MEKSEPDRTGGIDVKEKLTYQHGDVLCFRLEAMPKGLKSVPPKTHRHVLAEGEVTGHAHVICDLEHCDLYAGENEALYLEVRSAVNLTHEEHKTLTIEPGAYRIGRVREVDPFAEEIRRVSD